MLGCIFQITAKKMFNLCNTVMAMGQYPVGCSVELESRRRFLVTGIMQFQRMDPFSENSVFVRLKLGDKITQRVVKSNMIYSYKYH